MDEIIKQGSVILLAIIGVAILAIILSPRATTGDTLTAFFGGFSRALGAAEAPIIGPSSGFTGQGGYTSNAFSIPGFSSNFG